MQQPASKGERTPPSRGRLDRLPSRSTIATHRALFADAHERRCDLCQAPIATADEQGGSGLYVWTRGDEIRFEEPPLCHRCGPEVALIAERRFEQEGEEEG
jgi:hypothetical protein